MSLLSRVAKVAKKANSKNKYAYLYLHKRSRGLLSNPAKIKAFRVESLCFKVEPAVGVEPTT